MQVIQSFGFMDSRLDSQNEAKYHPARDREITDTEIDSESGALFVPQVRQRPLLQRIYGMIIMTLTIFVLTVSVILVKVWFENNKNIDGFDYLLIRSLMMFIATLIQVQYLRIDVFQVPTKAKVPLVLRWVFGLCAAPTFFIALKYLPLSKSTLIKNSSPLVVVIAAYFILKEKISKLDILAVIGAFWGIAIITKDSASQGQIYTNTYRYVFEIGLVIVSCFASAGVSICVKLLNKDTHHSISPFYFSVTCLIVFWSLFLLKTDLFHVEHMSLMDILLMSISGILSYISISLRSLASEHEDASVLAPFTYLQILLSFLWDCFIFSSSSSFSWADISGTILISVCVLTPMVRKTLRKGRNAIEKL